MEQYNALNSRKFLDFLGMQANFKVVLIYIISFLNDCVLKPNLIFFNIFLGLSQTPQNVFTDLV